MGRLDTCESKAPESIPRIRVILPLLPETGWLSEFEVSLNNRPQTCFIARRQRRPIGFACYDATALGYFGPTAIMPEYRGKGIGRALLLVSLLDMRLKGYGYAIIGDAKAQEFYSKVAGAVEIPDSEPGIYRGSVKAP